MFQVDGYYDGCQQIGKKNKSRLIELTNGSNVVSSGNAEIEILLCSGVGIGLDWTIWANRSKFDVIIRLNNKV